MRISEVMTTNIFKVRPEDSYSRILKLLIDWNVSGLPVVDENDKVVGIVSEKDLIFKIFPEKNSLEKNVKLFRGWKSDNDKAEKLKNLKAKDLMSKKVITIKPGDYVLKAISLFKKHKIRRIVVIDKGKFVGIVTTNDIYRNFLGFLSDSGNS